MTRQLLGGLFLCVALAAPLTLRAVSGSPSRQRLVDGDASAVAAGKTLFVHEFTANDPLCPNGDGLGPVFNARSCVACHRQGGVGGSGPKDANVHTYLVRTITCGFDGIVRATDQKSGLIHNAATRPEYQESQSLLQSINTGRDVHVTERKTPALFGAKLIDELPDSAIIANERRQQLKRGMSVDAGDRAPLGRAPRLAGGKIGRFGWKGQISSLNEFVQAACANELGLGNPVHTQAKSFAQASPVSGIDLTLEQCDQIAAFIGSLPQPIESPPTDVSPADVDAGRQHFTRVGCAECHQPDVGDVKGIYSDLLLHHMGQVLSAGGSYADPPPPDPEDLVNVPAKSHEWRTPPLWGVADAAPYLHDGRAATLHEAILGHTGQGQPSNQRYQQLGSTGQRQLIAFLRSLRAPEPGDAPANGNPAPVTTAAR